MSLSKTRFIEDRSASSFLDSNRWATLVYGRTYEVDFRLIALPEDFDDKNEQWTLKHILGATRIPEVLPNQIRWSVFKNEKYCVVGVTCMIRELIGNAGKEPDITKDSEKRSLYLFAGYVAKLTPDCSLAIPSLRLEEFQAPCEHIVNKWTEKTYQPASRIPERSQYKYEFIENFSSPSIPSHRKFNRSEQRIKLWLHSELEALWLDAARCPTPTSLCIGLATEADAIESPFLNATVLTEAAVGIRAKPAAIETQTDRYQKLQPQSYPPPQPHQPYGFTSDSEPAPESQDDVMREKISALFSNPMQFVEGEIISMTEMIIQAIQGDFTDEENNQNLVEPDYRQSAQSKQRFKQSKHQGAETQSADTEFGFKEPADCSDRSPTPDHSTTDSDWFN